MITRASEDEEYKEVRGRLGYLLVQMLASRYSNDCNAFFLRIRCSLGECGDIMRSWNTLMASGTSIDSFSMD